MTSSGINLPQASPSGGGASAVDPAAAQPADATTPTGGELTSGTPADAGPRRHRWQRVRRLPAWLLVALGYLVLAGWIFRAGWLHPGQVTYGGNDAYLYTWFLQWTPHAIGHGLDPFVTHRINAPDGANVLWSTPVVLLALLATPVTVLGGPVFTLTVLLTLAPVASGLALYGLLRRFVRVGPAAWGGLLYGFGPYVIGSSYGHLHLAFAPFPPVLALLLIDLLVPGPRPWVRRRSPGRTGLLLGLAVAGQAMIGEEVLASSALAAGIGVVVLAGWQPGMVRARVGPALRGLTVAATTAGVLLAWPLAVQFLGDGRVHGSIQPSGIAVSDLWTFVTPTPLQDLAPDAALRRSLRFTGNAVEVGGYLGIPLMLLAIGTAVTARHHPLVRVLAPVGIVMAVLSLGDHLHVGGHVTGIALPWLLGERVPVLRNALPSRFAGYVMLCAAAITAVGLDELWSRRRLGPEPPEHPLPRREPSRGGLSLGVSPPRKVLPRGTSLRGTSLRGGLGWAGAGMLVLATLAALIPAPMLTTSASTPAFFTGDGVRRIPADATTLVVPYPHPQDARAMLWQARAGFRFVLPGCYCTVPDASGRASFHGPGDALTSALIDVDNGTVSGASMAGSTQVRAAYTHLSPDAVVLGPAHRTGELRTLLVGLVGRYPQRVDGVDLWLPGRAGGRRS
ncbi:hypothetical protein [Frankia sp. R82]|uniref:hypothetical protein n=1 Tax=Frankia sp. R82 TaxID=2950553 RepID=UPI002042DA54|nr:hypothetical protein [Frankia sp. R82]MCM3885789.1 hypothetical protein [Frankia sp. R82]